MNIVVAVVVGTVAGAFLGAGGGIIGGLLAGGAIGFLLAKVSDLQSHIYSLEARLSGRNGMREAVAASASPQVSELREAVSPRPEPEPVAVAEAVTQPCDPHDAEFVSREFTFEPEPRRDFSPSQPSPLTDGLREFFTGGNLLVRVGIVILFFGVSFLAKYAADRGLVPIEIRMCGIAAGGVALLAAGWRLRERRAAYALALQGGGTGILYLTVFAAFRLYSLLPVSLTFALLVAVCVFSSILAVQQDSRTLALLGISGGFLAPVLASTGSGNHVALFSYYAVLNAGIFGIAWFRSWRVLNLIGFLFTFIISTAWGVTSYTPDRFATTEPFLILFFLMYSLMAVLFALRQPSEMQGYVDGTLVFGTPVVCCALQAALVSRYEYGLAWSALALGLYYLLLARGVFARYRDDLRMLAESFLAFGTVFATIAIPLAVDGRWSAAAWSVEGAAMVWAGLRQRRWPVRLFGGALLIGGGVFFIIDLPAKGGWPMANAFWLGVLLISSASLLSAWLLQRSRHEVSEFEEFLAPLLLAWGLLWWYAGGLQEVSRWSDRSMLAVSLCFISISSWGCSAAANRLVWNELRLPALILLPAMGLIGALQSASATHPLLNGGWYAWPLAFALHSTLLYENEERWEGLLPFLHAPAVWLFTLLAAWEANWWIGRAQSLPHTWRLLVWGIVPALILLGITEGRRGIVWPLARHRRIYLVTAAFPLAVATGVWSLYANMTCAGNASPLPYLPLLNPLDITIGLAGAVVALWYLAVHREEPGALSDFAPLALPLAGATLFVWLNGIVARSVHHWGGVAFSFHEMFGSFLFQTAISLTWCITAFCVMSAAARRGLRPLWLTGAVLLAAVVLKLFLVDLSGRGSVERIVSFVGVGLLLLVIGWFSPVPPRQGKGVEE